MLIYMYLMLTVSNLERIMKLNRTQTDRRYMRTHGTCIIGVEPPIWANFLEYR
jgi:hypothetical protein